MGECASEDEALAAWGSLMILYAATPSGANAPYKIVKRQGKWLVLNNTGETKAEFEDRKKALRYLRALYAKVAGGRQARGQGRVHRAGQAAHPEVGQIDVIAAGTGQQAEWIAG